MRGSRRLAAAVAAALLLVATAPAGADTEDRLLGRRLKDAAITALVKARLVAARPGNVRIDVDTDTGVVRLRGTVPGSDEWAEADEVAAGTPGVQRVWNELRIAEDAEAG
jgi:osmotically-inducible protein OsmY